MIKFAPLLENNKTTKHLKIPTLIKSIRAFRSNCVGLLGGKKKQFAVWLFFCCFILNSQTSVSSSSHLERTKAIEIYPTFGENNNGFGAGFIYYPKDNFQMKLYTAYRGFEYKSYNEKIIEAGFQIGITYLEGDTRGRYSFLGFFNLTPVVGVSAELVSVTSDTKLIEEYPKHIFGYVGAELEYSLTERLGLNLFFRQFYAFNGTEEQLGNWRYDFGLTLRYYLFK